MTDTPMRRIRLGLGAALLASGILVACGEGAPAGPAGGTQGPGEAGQAEPVKALDPALLLPIDERSVLMAGQVAVGVALAQAGSSQDAAEHLRLAISEVKPGGLTRLVESGLDPDLFEAAATALESEAPVDEVDAKLEAVEGNISLLRANAGGDPATLIGYLTKHCYNTYRDGVSLDNTIERPLQYQEAYGYAVVARDLSDSLDADTGDASGLKLELELLVRMWPDEGPVAGDVPAPVMTLASQINRVELELSALQ